MDQSVVSLCVIALLASTAAWAGQAEPSRAAHSQVVASKAGWTAPWPAGLVPRLDENPHPSVGQWSGQLVLAADGAELIRVEVYPNPAGKSLVRWVQTEWQEVTAKLLLQPIVANTKREPGLQATLGPAPQRHVQVVTWMQLGPDLAHVTCQVGANPKSKAWCDSVVAQLAPRGSR